MVILVPAVVGFEELLAVRLWQCFLQKKKKNLKKATMIIMIVMANQENVCTRHHDLSLQEENEFRSAEKKRRMQFYWHSNTFGMRNECSLSLSLSLSI